MSQEWQGMSSSSWFNVEDQGVELMWSSSKWWKGESGEENMISAGKRCVSQMMWQFMPSFLGHALNQIHDLSCWARG